MNFNETKGNGIVPDSDEVLRTLEILTHVFERNPDSILVCDENGKILLVNAQLELLSGYHRSDLKGKHVELLVPNAAKERHVEHRRAFLENPCSRPMGVGIQLSLQRKDETNVPVEINLSPIATSYGTYLFAIARRIRD